MTDAMATGEGVKRRSDIYKQRHGHTHAPAQLVKNNKSRYRKIIVDDDECVVAANTVALFRQTTVITRCMFS